ncbi:MAG: DUF3298 domain-containing protein [Cyclobacteriaceae bacterium]|nr:DUF3298 domain-containing protein [Cyclobacteriaceae bacterium]
MKKLRFSFLLVICAALSLSNCSTKETKTPLVIQYTMETFRLDSKGCAVDSLPCATYQVQFPVFSGLDSSVSHIIHQAITADVSMGNPDAEGRSMQDIAESFIAEFEEFESDGMGLPSANWYYKANVSIEILSDTLISLSVQEDFYTGGADGGSGVYFINVDPHSGSTITLDKIFKQGYSEALRQAGEAAFRKVREIESSESLADAGFEFPNNAFVLNENFGFTKEGIIFYFNSYEIASYAAGPTEVVIPYMEIKDWLRK